MIVTIVVALIVSVVSPLVLALVTAKQRRAEAEQAHEHRREEKREDWARLDAVADRAAEAAEKVDEVAVTAAHTAQLLVESDAARTAEAAAQSVQLTEIHSLVNSQMTERIKDQLAATETSLVSLKALMAHRTVAGVPATDEEHAAIDVTELRIAELKAQLADRATPT